MYQNKPNPKTILRVATSGYDIKRAQILRYKCFHGKDGIDQDIFDHKFNHVIIENSYNSEILATFRYRIYAPNDDYGHSYTNTFYNLSSLGYFDQSTLEIGRMCISPIVSDKTLLWQLWGGIAQLVNDHNVCFIFGCSSFSGIDAKPYSVAFKSLINNHVAPECWRPSPRVKNILNFINITDEISDQLGLPILLKSYLNLGGRVSDHAVIDYDMHTLHVFTGLEVSSVSQRQRAFLTGFQKPFDLSTRMVHVT